MADNLTIGIGVDTSKLRADMALVKNKLDAATKQMEAYRKEAAKTGDTSNLEKQARVVDQINRAYVTGTAVLRTYDRELALHAGAAAGAVRGIAALSGAHREFAEESKVNVREISKISKELGGLETSGFAVAKMFKEFPKVAVPVAIGAGIEEAGRKLANAAYTNITALDDLSKSSGFARSNIIALEKTFAAADVPASSLHKTLQSMGETFDKARVKSGDFGSMLSGVNVMRGGAGGAGSGVRVYRGSAAPQASSIEGGVTVFRGGQPFNLDPSKGFAGLIDPNQFKTVEDWFAAVRRELLNLDRVSPMLSREFIRGQGLDPVETLRGLRGSGAEEFARTRGSVFSDPRMQPGAIPLAREFGAGAREAGERGERLETTAGIPAMEAAVPIMKGLGDGAEKLAEAMNKTRENAEAFNKALTSGVDQGQLGAATESFSTAWTGTFANIKNDYDNLRNYIAANPLPVPMGVGTIPPPANEATGSPYATGGIVGGTGSGDTVPAWLTPGEYVNRRASVSYYGAGLFSALNSRAIPRDLFSRLGFAVGGLVGDHAAHFAEGGLAMTPAGTPVHLHLDGQSFATTASESVASALVATARRSQMRSAGLKPSWYGGRAGA